MSGRVVIVGGGIVGLCCAYYAVREGFEVTLLERDAEQAASCSVGSAGMVVPSHFTPLAAPGMVRYGLSRAFSPSSPFGVRWTPHLLGWGLKFGAACKEAQADAAKPILAKLNLLSSQEYGCLADELDDFGLTRKGLMMLCKDRRVLEEEAGIAKQAPKFGMEAHVMGPSELAKLDPEVEMDVVGGVYFPSDSHLSPDSLLPALRKKLRELGARLLFRTGVTDVRCEGRKVAEVKASEESYEADQFVIATGSWSEAMVSKLGLRLPIAKGKGYGFDIANPAQMPSVCSILVEGRVAVTPMPPKLRVAGTMELGAEDLGISERRVQGIRSALASYFPRLAVNATDANPVWAGFRPCSPDGLPFLGRSSRIDNLVIAAGHSMMGLSLGPITGRIVADLLLSRPTCVNLDLLSVDRYA